MNREIKFRGLRIDGKGWVYGMLVNSFEGTHIVEYDYFKPSNDESPILTEVTPESVGQFTGLKDKNGVEIYEGDTNQDRGIVEWNSDDCSFIWNYPEIESCAFEGEQDWCTITGNIHENN